MKDYQNIKKGDYDVIVVGSGPAGIAAATMSGRMGAKTLIIDACGSVGGIATVGMMSHFTGTADSKFLREVYKRAAEKNVFAPNEITVNIHHEMLKITYYEMLEEAGVDILLYTLVTDTIMNGNAVKGVVVQNKSGTGAYFAKVVIDASGDGDVAYYAGAEFTLGRESDHKMQPATLMFQVGGVDMERAVFPPSFETTIETEKGELQSLAREHLPHPCGHVLLYASTIPGIVTCNMTNIIDVDGTKAEDLTKAEIVCRKQMLPIWRFLREFVPGYENCYIISGASLIGIRETRHFKGLYTLTEDDIYKARHFDDAIAKGCHFNFDVHNISGSGLDKTGLQHEFKQQNGYDIPYGCIIPEKIDGLLLSGRNISGTHMAHSNFRVMPICMAVGEACGVAAALACKKNISPRNVDVQEIQQFI
ncbi:MAG: FAD-dependent oxidoreductase [Clostridia bacterium]|nr:FAD-dependent oxidoreductase [Clostridia bacterium]